LKLNLVFSFKYPSSEFKISQYVDLLMLVLKAKMKIREGLAALVIGA
jgi:hypothetical protein